MARKKKHPEHVNHERWLVSYADFITLLFAFFVVMFATSQVDTQKVGRFTESFSKAVGIEVFPESGKSILGGNQVVQPTTVSAKGEAALPSELEELRAVLSKKTATKQPLDGVQVLVHRNELVLRLADNIVFDSGNDEIKPAARTVLDRIAVELKPRPVTLRVEGHTDDKPIRTVRFRSNWDLSTARATAVVEDFAATGIAPERLSAAGYAQFHPVASNETAEGRAQNRRVDIIVSLAGEPTSADEKSDAGVDGEKTEGEKPEGDKSETEKAGAAKAEGDKPAEEEKTAADEKRDAGASPETSEKQAQNEVRELPTESEKKP